PRRALRGLWVADADGKKVPVGWLPADPSRLATYAAAAAIVLRRPPNPGPLVVLGQWEDRFLRVALRTSRWMEKYKSAPEVFHWTADRISRTDLINALGCGPGVAVYYGHGRANGWAGYHGVRTGHFPAQWEEPIGGLLALCCENASRHGGRASFTEELVLRGVCVSALASAGKTRHEDNRLLGPALCEALAAGKARTLADLVASAEVPAGFWKATTYRFIGDPAAPLSGACDAIERADRVVAPGPNESLAPWPESPAELAEAEISLKRAVQSNHG
ncbi:MAG: C25 family cysteine peptidase, partial [Lacunisphaera sp.]